METRIDVAMAGIFGGCLLVALAASASAQAPPTRGNFRPEGSSERRTVEASDLEPRFAPTYGPLDAAVDAQKRHDARRLDEIDRQRRLNAAMRQTAGAGPDQYGYYPSNAYLYAYPGMIHLDPRRRAVGRSWRSAARAYRHGATTYRGRPAYPYPAYPSVFTPWPLIPGDIFGYPYVDRVEQPLGHKKIATGPNGEIYRPVYESDLKPKDAPRQRPSWRELLDKAPVEGSPREAPTRRQERLRGAAPELPGIEAIPAPPAEPGPREF